MDCPRGQNSSFWSVLGTTHQRGSSYVQVVQSVWEYLPFLGVSPAVMALNEILPSSLSVFTENFQDEKVQNIPPTTKGKNKRPRSFVFPAMMDSDHRGRKNSLSASFHTGSSGPPANCGESFIQQDTRNRSRCGSTWLIPEVTGHLISHLNSSGLCLVFTVRTHNRPTTAWH